MEASEKLGDCESSEARCAASEEKIGIVASGTSERMFVVLPQDPAPSSIESSQLRLVGSSAVLEASNEGSVKEVCNVAGA